MLITRQRFGKNISKLSCSVNVLKNNTTNSQGILDIKILEILMFGAVKIIRILKKLNNSLIITENCNW